MSQRDKLVQAALSQKGVKSGAGYVEWYNQATGSRLGLKAAWCAIFVSWCARQAGISTKVIPNFAGCTTGRRLFQKLGVWYPRDRRTPQKGDLILFDWDSDPSLSEHVGIVTASDSKYVYTIEGNSGNQVREKRYGRNSSCVLGYVAWKEEEDLSEKEVKGLIGEALEEYRKNSQPTVYHSLSEVPDWGYATVKAFLDSGFLKGDEKGDLNLSQDMLRVLVIMERKEGVL